MKSHIVAVVNSQLEYWRREFHASVILKDETFRETVASLVSKGFTPVIQLDNDPMEFDFLKSLPEKSVIGWAYADESLDLDFAARISDIKALAILLRPYHLNEFKISNLVSSAKYVASNLDNLASTEERLKLILWFFRGIALSSREQRIRGMYKKANLDFINFPLGYTDVFSTSLVNHIGIEMEELSRSHLDLRIRPIGEIEYDLAFVGQVGQVVRAAAINAARDVVSSKIITRSGYGAGSLLNAGVKEKGIEYLSIALKSKYILCPPGNISGNSFRIHETVVLGKIPIVLSHIASDPNFISPFEIKNTLNKSRGWKESIRVFTDMSEKDYILQVKANLLTFRNQVNETRTVITSLLR